ncbi:MAG TPA: VOC family protein [Bacteroidales bacterium]|nr:VOC family protein [Bacteroidales bacterium]
MKLGAFSVSLNVKDIHASKKFYESLGFNMFAGDISQGWLIMKNEHAIIGLYQGMIDQNMLTFNPAWDENAKTLGDYDDIRDIQHFLKEKGIKPEHEADETSTGPAHIRLKDPDGNVILLDQVVTGVTV